MAGKVFNLLTVLLTLMGLAFAQTQTVAPDSTVSMDITAMSSAGMSSSTSITSTEAGDGSETIASMSLHQPSSQTTTSAPKATTTSTGLPSTTIPNPIRNAGRRPSEPGLRKLTIVAGLVTYGLILL
ncbi:hypothetical protein QQS21_003308 [Conoideocrella luteorostrata]|uniref:Uncharacterized protein n=1 Tax=Conoideocrella luteorostrata TaxID=1105319 RepID=A0AAJ0G0L0_9HYPO|nr:hypothetical protein QQS21_003308 [Conoideocrella luteorostrata]